MTALLDITKSMLLNIIEIAAVITMIVIQIDTLFTTKADTLMTAAVMHVYRTTTPLHAPNSIIAIIQTIAIAAHTKQL